MNGEGTCDVPNCRPNTWHSLSGQQTKSKGAQSYNSFFFFFKLSVNVALFLLKKLFAVRLMWHSSRLTSKHACGKAVLPDPEPADSVYRIIGSAKLTAGSNLPTQTWWGQDVWPEYGVRRIGSEGEWWMSDSDLFFFVVSLYSFIDLQLFTSAAIMWTLWVLKIICCCQHWTPDVRRSYRRNLHSG